MKVLRKELSSTFQRCCLLRLYKVVLMFDSVDKILTCNKAVEMYVPVELFVFSLFSHLKFLNNQHLHSYKLNVASNG